MGRPSSCDCRCGEEEVQPAITDCENLLCVAFIDENSSGIGSLEAKMLKFIEAFPNRVMVILDVAWSELTYTSAFINHPRAFSLSLEYDISTTGLIRKMVRDNGQESIAITNDPWERIKTILDRYGLTTWLNTSNTEVSIFIDNSGSMRATNVASTVNKLEADLEADGKSRTESIINTSEDIICPFVVPECCEAGAVAEELATLCGYTWNCPAYGNINLMPPVFWLAGSSGPTSNYVVSINGQNYQVGPGSDVVSVLTTAGDSVSIELISYDVCSFPFSPSPGHWHTRQPEEGYSGGEYDFQIGTFSAIFPLSFSMPAGGIDVFPDVQCSATGGGCSSCSAPSTLYVNDVLVSIANPHGNGIAKVTLTQRGFRPIWSGNDGGDHSFILSCTFDTVTQGWMWLLNWTELDVVSQADLSTTVPVNCSGPLLAEVYFPSPYGGRFEVTTS